MPEPGASRRLRFNPRLVAAGVLVVLVVVFIFENTTRTRIRFLIPIVTVPLWVALLVATLVGTAAGALIMRYRR